METIILLAFIIGGSFPFVTAFIANDYQIAKRTVKVVKANLNRRKQHVPGIVTSDMLALTPRNKDWGPDGKLTRMWDDAFAYWQIENPQEVMASYREKDRQLKVRKAMLEDTVRLSEKLYDDFINSRGCVLVSDASEAKTRSREATRKLNMLGTDRLRDMTMDERVMGRLAERYSNEVFYNNDLVYMSAQKQMPTFDYIALTSV